MPKILALDYGEKRIGVAVSDESGQVAFPRQYIDASGKDEILDLIKSEEIQQVIIGLPVGMAGQETEATSKARELASWIRDKSGIPAEMIDERLTSSEMHRDLKASGFKAEDIREMIDSAVAQKILERYLEKRKTKN